MNFVFNFFSFDLFHARFIPFLFHEFCDPRVDLFGVIAVFSGRPRPAPRQQPSKPGNDRGHDREKLDQIRFVVFVGHISKKGLTFPKMETIDLLKFKLWTI